MNKYLEKYAREFIKNGLSQLSDANHRVFKRMYSHDNLDMPINDVVDKMSVEHLNWAMMQVQSSVDRLDNRS